MAYNREWDRGKDNWDNPRYHSRDREDDYYGDGGKRRKYNNGGYEGYDDYNSYNNNDYNSSYGNNDYNNSYGNNSRQGQGDWQQDYGQDDRSRGGAGGFAKKRMVPSEPSPHVIFLGLDPDFTEADLQAYLVSNGCTVETVTIIRDRTSGLSKGFGFAQFTTVDQARAFVDPCFPFIQMPPPASHGASAQTAFYKALETGAQHNGRRIKIDYSQSAMPADKARMQRGNMNDGTRDIGNTQSPVLLFRGLDPLSGPQAIHQAMLSSSGAGRQGAKGMRRIILIKDKVTMASFGFAFVEFVDVPAASTVLANTMSTTLHPSGFRISDRPVAASFAHPYSFQPVTDFLQRDESCLTSTMSLGGVEGTWVRYWDESSTIAVLEFKVEEPAQQAAAKEKEKEKEKKKKVKEPDAQLKPLPVAPSELPLSDKPVTLSFSKNPIKLGTATVKSLGFSMDDANGEDEEEPAVDPTKPIVVKKVAPLISSKKTVNNINKWNQVQEELSHDTTPLTQATQAPAPQKAAPAPTIAPTPVASSSSRAATESTPEAETEFEFSDVASLMCLLCARQFKTLDVLKRHNKESDLHKKNFKDANLREVARQKVAARKAAAPAEQPKYRDRASERRTLFNQPDAPMPEKDANSHLSKKRAAEAPRTPTPPPAAPAPPGQDASNMGNKLLKMMGWKEGAGLGQEGEGRVNPIETAVYTPGVGLGAAKAKDIGKYTEGFTSYAAMAQDSARERYNS